MSNVVLIKKSEILEYVKSFEYSELENVPISPGRALSYAHNPRSEDSDVVLLMIFDQKKLIAYRTLFYDFIETEKEKIRFAWISGSWVHPEYRRQGFSKLLIKKSIEVSEGKIMFSNYAPISHKLYVNSGYFEPVYENTGYKFYFRFCFTEILSSKYPFFKKIKFLLQAGDFVMNLFIEIRKHFYKKIKTSDIVEYNRLPGEEYDFLIKNLSSNNAFKRNSEYFKYITDFPWVKEEMRKDPIDRKYQFSTTAKRFKYKFIQFGPAKNGLYILKIREKNFTIPYFYIDTVDIEKLASYIKSFGIEKKMNTFTSYFSELNCELLKNKRIFLFSKKISTNFYATPQIAEVLRREKLTVFPGDGDNIFT